jgi:hypothetical protein
MNENELEGAAFIGYMIGFFLHSAASPFAPKFRRYFR